MIKTAIKKAPSRQERYFIKLKLALAGDLLKEPWLKTQNAFLRAYEVDPQRGEVFQYIIQHYMEARDWQTAYIFSKFAKETFHRQPIPQGTFKADEVLYQWKFLYFHTKICFHCGRRRGMLAAQGELIGLMKLFPEYFTAFDILMIRKKARFKISDD